MKFNGFARSPKMCPPGSLAICLLVWLPFLAFTGHAADLTDKIDKYCLNLSYPEVEIGADDWIKLKNGSQFHWQAANGEKDVLNGSLAESMEPIYPLEPHRPDTPPGFSPGRKRPYLFYELLYGVDKKEVSAGVALVKFMDKSFPLARQAAKAFENAVPSLRRLVAKNPALKKYLKPEGGFYWRKIAGEKYLSAHSYGIALDIGVDASPYWRWSKLRPHPLQKSYPPEIVAIFEENGFIWGGKWHEYDLMHYEYRPELLCKARMANFRLKPFAIKLRIASPQ